MNKDIMEVVTVLNTFAKKLVKVGEREDVLNDMEVVNPLLAQELRNAICEANKPAFRWVKDYSADME